jgi:hypothetical protein
MDIVTLHINSHTYRLPADADTETLGAEFLTAVRTGGALVGIGLALDRWVSVLVTAESQIVFEHIRVPDHRPDFDDPLPSWVEDLEGFPSLLEP